MKLKECKVTKLNSIIKEIVQKQLLNENTNEYSILNYGDFIVNNHKKLEQLYENVSKSTPFHLFLWDMYVKMKGDDAQAEQYRRSSLRTFVPLKRL